MFFSYRLKNGRIVDPSRGIDCVGDIYIRNSRITSPEPDGKMEIGEDIDASGCLVFPGLIDFHVHIDRYHSDYGILPDAMTFPNGVTSAVDAGSSGSANFEGFYRDVVCSSSVTLKSFVSSSPMGVATGRHVEKIDPECYDAARLEYLFERFSAQILGLKVRVGKFFSGEYGLVPVERTKELARRLETVMCVHVIHPEESYDEVLSHFEKGDVLCHCFQSQGGRTILNEAGKVHGAVREARARGVVFDGAAGRGNHDFRVIQRALGDGFPPDIISTDATANSIYKKPVFALPYTMSCYWAMGMPLNEIVRATTSAPARLMKMEEAIGTLAPGALADVAVFKIREKKMVLRDLFGNQITGDQLLVPQMTIKAGRMVFRQIDFLF
jgi:predicted amidohydrolase